MTTARSRIVNPSVTRFYHVISRCVRRAFLCGGGNKHRKDWLEARLQALVGIFAIDVCGYAIMDNHLHVLVRLSDGDEEQAWSPVEVVERWARLFPPFGEDALGPRKISQEWITSRAANESWIAVARERLTNLGWFMKCLKEPLARKANREDGCTGAFWEGRYRSVAILDESSLLATAAYIDLNPVAAGMAEVPEESAHTSMRARVEHARTASCSPKREIHQNLKDETPRMVSSEDEHWLCPLGTESREGMIEGLDLGGYLNLVDWVARAQRPGKKSLDERAPLILERLGIALEPLTRRVALLVEKAKWVGTVAGERCSARLAAMERGVPFVKNLWGALA